MGLLLVSSNLPHPFCSPCGADVSSILVDPKATHTQKHHLGPCFSCGCVCVHCLCDSYVWLHLNTVLQCVCVFVCALRVGVDRLSAPVSVSFGWCVWAAPCLHTPTWTGNSHMSFGYGRWDLSESVQSRLPPPPPTPRMEWINKNYTVVLWENFGKCI